MTGKDTIGGILQARAARAPDEIALLAPGRAPLDFRSLNAAVTRVAEGCNRLGIGRGDVVAILLPDGWDMALAFLGVTGAACAAPLNPAYTEEEIAFSLDDLGARALLIGEAEEDGAATRAAARLGVPVVRWVNREATLLGTARAGCADPGRARPDDIALILHTSGTTSRPKRVPLTHANLVASADHIAASLALDTGDGSLCVMPLFHIHGLVAGLLAPLHAGGSVVCAPGWRAQEFLGWVREFRPTWYTAVPTMHRAALDRLRRDPGGLDGVRLRLVRSCSSALSPGLMRELEDAYGAPVVEAYGMTEAAHQIACNPLPPAARKPGSVGRATGTRVAILSEAGDALLGPGALGEIVIRGPNVTSGYMGDEGVNGRAFVDGWFRTGDQGTIDADGYIHITGRLKELINRGGEKIAPREIDEVVMGHPSVREALAFAIPHARLGETVGVAVVADDPSLSEEDLQRYCAGRLAHFKVPDRVLIVEAIPRGPTGKPRRVGLAELLGVSVAEPAGVAGERGSVEPRTETERELAKIWCRILGVEGAGVADRFNDLGGDSMLALHLAEEVRRAFGVEIDLVDLYAAATVEEQARRIDAACSGGGESNG